MADSEVLRGKVLKRTLPVVPSPAPAGAPANRRFFLPQGELAQIYDGDEPIRYIAFVELRAGGVRGNHYHKFKEEFVYVIQGELELVVEELTSKTRARVWLQTGDLAVIQTGIAHALRTVTPGHAIEFSKTRFDAGDSYPFQLA